MNFGPTNRREAIASLTASALASASVGHASQSGDATPKPAAAPTLAATPAATQADARLDWRQPATQMDALIRMRGALDDRLVISFLEGVYYGVVAARIRPLYGLSAGLFRQYRPRSDGGWDYANFELVYVTDLESGELLTEFRNPYTGRTGKPPQTRLGPSRLTISPQREVIRGAALAADDAGFHRFRPARIVGDDVWILEESAVQAPPPLNFSFNEVLTYRARAADLADRNLTHVPTEVHFNSVIGWRAWQGMETFEGAPGHVMGNCAGRVVTRLEELPARYRSWTERHHPDVLTRPLELLASAWR
jgi:hypothetical protein